MTLYTSTAEREAIATVEFLPAISIIMPFTPVMTVKKNLEHSLKNVMGKIEAVLTTHYTVEKAIPVLIKLRNLIYNLNYSTHKKSIAIFVSPVAEKVYYLNVEMEEKIVIDPSFKISQLVGCKKEKKEYLILLLGDKFSKMYLGNGAQLKLIKSNKLLNNQHCENCTAEKTTGFPGLTSQTEFITNRFLVQMDQGLSIILKSYPLPVIVMGPENLLGHFERITSNDEYLARFVHGNYAEVANRRLISEIEHLVIDWKKLKQQYLLKRIEKAKAQNKLRTGVDDVLKATSQNKGRLLIVEKKFVTHFQTTKTFNPFYKLDYTGNEAFFIKNEVDDIIKNMFENGGDVEFIEDGLLKNYRNIALIEGNQ